VTCNASGIVHHEKVFKGDYLSVSRLTVELSKARRTKREIVHVPNAVAVLPVDENGTVQMVRQYRHAINRSLVEIPAGIIDHDETEEDAAVRECEEETGYVPQDLHRLITYAHAEGYSTGFITLFLGRTLSYTGNIHLDAGEDLVSIEMDFQILCDKVARNEIIDSKTILATLLTQRRMNKLT